MKNSYSGNTALQRFEPAAFRSSSSHPAKNTLSEVSPSFRKANIQRKSSSEMKHTIQRLTGSEMTKGELTSQMMKEEEISAQMMKEEELPSQMMKEEELPSQLMKEEELPSQMMKEQEMPIQHKMDPGGLPSHLHAGISHLSGVDMSDIKVHYNSPKPAQMQALATAQGSDIHLGPGQERHLPHEAWHVAQQKQGKVTPTTQVNGLPVNDNPGLENEADIKGAEADKEGKSILQ